MRRYLGLIAAIATAAMAVAHVSGSTKLDAMAKALGEAKSVKATYTVQTIGSPASSYDIQLKKPNMARVETPTQVIVANGTDLTTYDKAQKAYYKVPQNADELKSIFSGDELKLFGGFFDPAALKVVSAKDLGAKTVGGSAMNVVEAVMTSNGRKVATLYIDPNDNVARKGQIDLNDPAGKSTTIIDTKSLALNGDIADSAFQFVAPAGSREVNPEELSAKWFYSLDEAVKVASASNRRIFVDFYAEWCGPCKRLEADCFGTPEFAALAKKVVFLRIDVDKQESVSRKYGIEAMPTQMILDQNGNVINKTVGYANRSTFFNWIYSVVGRP